MRPDPRIGQHRRQLVADSRFRLANDPVDQFLTGRDIVDQALDHPRPENPLAEIAGFEQLAPGRSRDQFLHVAEPGIGLGEAADHFFADRALPNPGGILEFAEDKKTAALVIVDIGLFDIVVDRCLLRGTEARAHVDSVRAQRQRCNQTAPVTEATRCQHRNLHLVRGRRDQDQSGNIILARMTGTFEAVDRNDVAPGSLRRQRMTDRRTFVQNGDAVRFHPLPDFAHRGRASGFHDLDAAFDDGIGIGVIVRRIDRRKDGQVHAKGLVGHRPAFFDLFAQRLRRGLGQRSDDAQATGVGNGTRHLRRADPLHSALDDRMLDL